VGYSISESAMHNITDFIATSSILFDRSIFDRRVRIKCPHCGQDASLEHALAIDAEIRCLACGELSEFRQMREAWCVGGRDVLTRAFPEIVFPHDRLAAHRH
jgi:ribosomal protein S27E